MRFCPFLAYFSLLLPGIYAQWLALFLAAIMDPFGKGPHAGMEKPGSLTIPPLGCLLPNFILNGFCITAII